MKIRTPRSLLTTLALITVFTPALIADTPQPRPSFRATRVSKPPTIDGDLSDEAWRNAQEITEFTQHDPDDGKPATMPTSVRIVYDDHAIYFGVKMVDTQKPTGLLARRDNFVGTDESSLVERLDQIEVSVVLGSDRNIKITKPSDMDLARLFLAEELRPQVAS